MDRIVENKEMQKCEENLLTTTKATIQLSKRLQAIADCVPGGVCVADVGTDHGYIPVYLAQRTKNPIKRALAMDINKGPLEKAEQNICKFGVQALVETRLSNGLEKLQVGEVDTLIIAGMGGQLMASLLMKEVAVTKSLKTLILSPHLDEDQVRKTVHQIGFKIVREQFLLDESKSYIVIQCEPGQEKYDHACDYLYGKQLLAAPNPLYLNHLVRQSEKWKVIYSQLGQQTSEAATIRKQELQKALEIIREAIDRLGQTPSVPTLMEVAEMFHQLANPSWAEPWDNSGILVGQKSQKIRTVMVALDPTDDVINQAIKQKVDLLMTHHPLFLKSMKAITDETLEGRKLLKLIQANIALLCGHTNFDQSIKSSSRYIAEGLSLQNIVPFGNDSSNNEVGIGVIGHCDETTLEALIGCVQTLLKTTYVHYVGDLNKAIKSVAICSGSGMSEWSKARVYQPDVYLTGDLKYHDALLAKELGLTLIDATHFATEHNFTEIIMKWLKEYFPEIKCITAQNEQNPIQLY